MTEDAVLDLNGRVMEGKDDIRTKVFNTISSLDTTHLVSNARIDLKDGETAASLTAVFMAQHYRGGQGTQPDATHFLAGGMYFIELVKDQKDGLWKSKHWRIKITWTEGDQGVMSGH